MNVTLNGRRVCGLEVDGVNTKDFPDFSDAFISRAYWNDSDEELTEEELETLSYTHPGLAYELALERFS